MSHVKCQTYRFAELVVIRHDNVHDTSVEDKHPAMITTIFYNKGLTFQQ